jgi:ankyrin repeat protein
VNFNYEARRSEIFYQMNRYNIGIIQQWMDLGVSLSPWPIWHPAMFEDRSVAMALVKLFQQAGTDLNTADPYDGYTALHNAVQQENVSLVQYLIDQGVALNPVIKGNAYHSRETPLDIAKDRVSNTPYELLKVAGAKHKKELEK